MHHECLESRVIDRSMGRQAVREAIKENSATDELLVHSIGNGGDARKLLFCDGGLHAGTHKVQRSRYDSHSRANYQCCHYKGYSIAQT